MLYAALSHHFGLRIPLNEMGAFNLWAWQLVWVLGLWCGVCWAKECLPAEKWATRMLMPAAVVAAVLFVLRYFELSGLSLGRGEIFFDKWHLGIVRLFNFAAIAMLLIRFRSAVKPLAVRPLVLLGQSSLQAFCAHFLFCFLGIGMMGDADRIFGWRQFALIGVTFATLLHWLRKFSRGVSLPLPRLPAVRISLHPALQSPLPNANSRALPRKFVNRSNCNVAAVMTTVMTRSFYFTGFFTEE
jgi:hypothetical protein